MQESQVSQEEGLFDQFPAQVQEDVHGLIHLGYLEETIEWCGHSFTLHTLNGEEELAVGLLCKEYAETLAQAKAWAWANVSQSLAAVDGDPDFCPPIGPDPMIHAKARFRYLLKWFWPTIEELYRHYALLVERQVAAIRAVRDLSNRSLENFSPFPDSSTEQGGSDEPEGQEDIREFLD